MACILVVDDDEKLAEGLCEVLELSGFDCRRASGAKEAAVLAAELKPAFAITDIQLPDGDGFSVCAGVKAARPDARVLIMSGRAPTAEERLLGQKAGADGYLSKPFDPGALSARVREILSEKTK